MFICWDVDIRLFVRECGSFVFWFILVWMFCVLFENIFLNMWLNCLLYLFVLGIVIWLFGFFIDFLNMEVLFIVLVVVYCWYVMLFWLILFFCILIVFCWILGGCWGVFCGWFIIIGFGFFKLFCVVICEFWLYFSCFVKIGLVRSVVVVCVFLFFVVSVWRIICWFVLGILWRKLFRFCVLFWFWVRVINVVKLNLGVNVCIILDSFVKCGVILLLVFVNCKDWLMILNINWWWFFWMWCGLFWYGIYFCFWNLWVVDCKICLIVLSGFCLNCDFVLGIGNDWFLYFSFFWLLLLNFKLWSILIFLSFWLIFVLMLLEC